MCWLQNFFNILFQISTARLLMQSYVFICERLTRYAIQNLKVLNTKYIPHPSTISILRGEHIFTVSAL